MMKLIIAGGGTGGHVLAGISVADAWASAAKSDAWASAAKSDAWTSADKNAARASILFVGARGGMEEKLVPRAGYALELLWVGSLNRVSLKKRMKTLCQLPLSFLRSAAILLTFKPEFVLGVGGYASGPVLLMAKVLRSLGLLKVQIAILEQNSVPGLTNRILGQIADRIFAAFPGTEAQFPRRRVMITGNPIRSSMKRMDSAPRNPLTLFVFGGSQGAFAINSLVLEALPFLKNLADQIKWIHQTGEKDYDRVLEGYKKAGISARVEAFIDDMPAAYRQASLLICRSGSSTLSELAAVGRAAILIPLPTAADNHQEHNARIITEVGAATLFIQSDGRGEALAGCIRDLISHPSRLEEMEQKVALLFRPNAAVEIINGLLSRE